LFLALLVVLARVDHLRIPGTYFVASTLPAGRCLSMMLTMMMMHGLPIAVSVALCCVSRLFGG
jgi:hypothetical protein